MKRCPTCSRTYADETLTYCLDDGSLLSAPYDPEATQRIYPSRVTNSQPTEVLPSNPSHSLSQPQSRNSIMPYVIVGLLALIIGGGVVVLLRPSDKDSLSTEPQKTTTSAAPVQSTKPPSKREEIKTVTVSSQRMWTDTNIQVKKGDLIEINASGKANASGVPTDGAYKWVDPDGWGYAPEFTNSQTGEPMKWVYVLGRGTSLMCLTGKVGRNGQPFKVGRYYTFTSQENGTLYLGANDVISDYKGNIIYSLDEMGSIWPDNGGSFTANVKITSTE